MLNSSIYTNQNQLEFVSFGHYDWKSLERAKKINLFGSKVNTILNIMIHYYDPFGDRRLKKDLYY